MHKQKKQDLAEHDSRWEFEKTVKVPIKDNQAKPDWQNVRKQFNALQQDNGDLYMTIANLPLPSKLDKIKQWYRNRKQDGEPVMFHHTQVYNFYLKLAYEQGISVGEAIYKVLYEQDELRDYFDLGKTVNVSISNVDAMDTAEKSQVSKDELQEFIEDEK